MRWELLEKLCGLQGVSGREDPVREELIRQIDGYCTWQVDALGNLLAFKKGKNRPGKKLLLSAHMDEVGLIVSYVEENGSLRFGTVGGIDRRILPGKGVWLGETYGVIGGRPIHLKSAEERDKALEVDQLSIDLGVDSREKALELVQLGDRAVFDSRYACFGEGFLRGRALDDRAGCALLVELIREELPYDLWFAFTVQEETGCAGARTAAAQILPDRAIAIETTTACDIPDLLPEKVVCSLGAGPVLSFMDRGTVYDMDLYHRALQAAGQAGILCQPKAGIYGGNESRMVQAAGAGTAVLAVSMPCRYLHTPSCVLQKRDIEATLDLLRLLTKEFAE